MTPPTDEQVEELAKAMRRAGGMEDDWEKVLFPQNIRAVWARYARTAWDHVARQIMPIQVGEFLAAVDAERDYQRHRWGDEHDDEHSLSEWSLLVLRYAGRLGEAVESGGDVRLAAVNLAAVAYAVHDAVGRPLVPAGDEEENAK